MRPTTATINQEVKDFKETYKDDIREIKSTLHEILEQAKKTNGRVTKVETLQYECPARDSYKKGRPFQYSIQVITLVIAGLAFIFSIATKLL